MKGQSCSILDYGAVPGSDQPATAALQRAVDACHAGGGGTVQVPAGTFTIGTVFLRSHIRLDLAPGARLLGSPRLEDYRVGNALHGMLVARDAAHIALTGQGTIDGNGDVFMCWDRAHRGPDYDARCTRQGEAYLAGEAPSPDGPVAFERRPGMQLVFANCEDVVITDLTLANSPSWMLRLGYCDDVRVRGIALRNHLMIPNSDGIHVTSSRNVRISDCDIRAGDDAIAITGFGDEVGDGRGRRDAPSYETARCGNRRPITENIVVSNCTLSSRSSAVRAGYGPNPIRDCVFHGLAIHESNRGLGVFLREAAAIENLLFSDIVLRTRLHDGHWWGNGEPIHVSAIARHEGAPALGRIRCVRFRNVLADCEAGAVLYGAEDSPLEDLALEDLRLRIANGRLAPVVGGNFDLRPAADLRFGVFEHEIPGIYAQHAHRLVLRNTDVVWGPELADYHTYAFDGRELVQPLIDGLRGTHAFPARETAGIRLERTTGETVRHCDGLVRRV